MVQLDGDYDDLIERLIETTDGRSDGPIRWGLRRYRISQFFPLFVGVMVQLDGDYDNQSIH